MALLGKYFSTNHFVSGRSAHQCVTGKDLFAAWASTGCGGVIYADAFFEAFDQCAFTAFAVFEELGFALTTEYIDCFCWAFFVRFCHVW